MEECKHATINHYYGCCDGMAGVTSGIMQDRQIFDKAGTYTFTAPITGKYKVTVVGAGGGGGGAAFQAHYSSANAGGGGGAGGHTVTIVSLKVNDIVQVQVGSGGRGGTAPSEYIGSGNYWSSGSSWPPDTYWSSGSYCGSGGYWLSGNDIASGIIFQAIGTSGGVSYFGDFCTATGGTGGGLEISYYSNPIQIKG